VGSYPQTKAGLCYRDGVRVNSSEDFCSRNDSNTKPACCCTNAACNWGTFESIFYLLKEAMPTPHVLDVDWMLDGNFEGNLTAQFLKMPNYLNEDITGFPLISGNVDLTRFMNLEPFIPLCQLGNLWQNKKPQWGTTYDSHLFQASFCTLFKPSKFYFLPAFVFKITFLNTRNHIHNIFWRNHKLF
jgi:hypothetical protein